MTTGRSHGVTCVILLALILPTAATAQPVDPSGTTETPTVKCQVAPGEAHPWTNQGYSPECRARLALTEFKNLDE